MLKKYIRKCTRPLIAALDFLTRPKPIARTEQELRQLARQTRGMSLYDYKGCSASLKAWREIRRLSLDIERRDISACSIHQDNLLAELGELKAPCLRIEERGQVIWLDDQDEIIHYLHQRFDRPPESGTDLYRV